MTIVIFQEDSGELGILTSMETCKAADIDIFPVTLCSFG